MKRKAYVITTAAFLARCRRSPGQPGWTTRYWTRMPVWRWRRTCRCSGGSGQCCLLLSSMRTGGRQPRRQRAPSQSGTGRVVLSVTGKGSTPVISVCDNGPGIPTEDRIRVRDRVLRLDQARATPGTGLGLSPVAAIAELHGASLELDDNAQGLCARIVFAAEPSLTNL